MAIAGWLVIVELVGTILKWAAENLGEPTEEIKKRLLAQVTLPTPGEADSAKAEIESHLPPK